MDVNKKVRLNPGYFVSFIVIIIPTLLWILNYDFTGLDNIEIFLTVILKMSAFAGMSMFAWSLILSGRYKIFDSMFRGLDKVYVAHRFFGTASIAILLFHPLTYSLLTFYREGIDDIFGYFLSYRSLAFTLGRISLYGLILVGLWSIFIKVKHETFILIHKILGILFIIGAIHAFWLGTILSQDILMWWYMFILSVLGTITFVHYSLLGDYIHPYYKYKIQSIKKLPGNVWELNLKPKYRIVKFRSGQFMYLSFETLSEKSYHPFTVSSGEHSSTLQFYIKELGDLTKSFDKLHPGNKVRIKGPYGGFVFDEKRFEKQLWIGAGIGITPFISKARTLHSGKHQPEVELIYATSNKHEAFAADEFQHIEHQVKKFNYTLLNATQFGQKSLEDLAEHFGDLSDCAIYICGPPGMLSMYAEQSRKLGLEDQLYYEEFNF